MNRQKFLRGLLGAVGALAILAGVTLFTYKTLSSPNGQNPPSQPTAEPSVEVSKQDPAQTAALQKNIASYNEVLRAYAQKNYKKTVQLGLAYGDTADNDTTSRMNAYVYCIYGAVTISDTATRDDCNAKATVLAATLPDADAVNTWKLLLQNAMQNKVDIGDQNSGTGPH